MDMMSLIVSLVGGAVGGNVAGAAMKDYSLGPIGNSVLGILGGGLGGFILERLGLAAPGGGATLAATIGSALSGGVGGGVVMILVGVLKNILTSKA
jgi:uncharacterized membrane protein YeaQ/YmgE (transglycosylase-associated protein family)